MSRIYEDVCVRMVDNKKLEWMENGRCMDDTEIGIHIYDAYRVDRMS